MEYTSYIYNKPECKLTINKMPIWLKEIEYNGDEDNGAIVLHSQEEYDEIYGPSSKIDIDWEKKERMDLFYYKEVENSIEIYNAIGIVVTSKKKDWLMSHEFTSWFGHRRKMIRRRFYVEKVIHGIFYCDITERLFNIHASVIESLYKSVEPNILKSYTTIECH
ncbi:MAG: hypothetical protein ACXABO_04605 [Promethearchaeota archaeon]|jgi:hypothetical protein